MDELGSFLQVTLVAKRRRRQGWTCRSWISQARDDRGDNVGSIDVAAMLADLHAAGRGAMKPATDTAGPEPLSSGR